MIRTMRDLWSRRSAALRAEPVTLSQAKPAVAIAVAVYYGFAMLGALFGVAAYAIMFAWPQLSEAPQWLVKIILYGCSLSVAALVMSATVAVATSRR